MTCCKTGTKTRDDFKPQARLHRALASEARLMIVDRLQDCECSVGGLAEAVGLDMSTVSKHLSILLTIGIVDNRKDCCTVLYRLLSPSVLDIISCTDRLIAEGMNRNRLNGESG